MDGKWLSILEYANYKNKSISTVRRYIKAGRVKFKEENGKYFIWAKKYLASTSKLDEEKEILKLRLENDQLKLENRKLTEQLSEMKMLSEVLENENKKYRLRMELPELPALPEM